MGESAVELTRIYVVKIHFVHLLHLGWRIMQWLVGLLRHFTANSDGSQIRHWILKSLFCKLCLDFQGNQGN